jgi:ATP-dependent Clp protease ATP-binding subunit ClpA
LDPGIRSPEILITPRAAAPGNGLRALARAAGARLGRRVVGQEEAVDCVGRALRRAAAGLASGRGPLATLLFVGPTGVGKTELARALADELGGARRLVRIDCSEYGTRHETSKLLGAPPGYVGHERGGLLARRLPSTGEFVLLLDEVEKADAALHELLLQVLDEGRLTNGLGATLDFRRAFVVLTSNAGTRELLAARERVGFDPPPLRRDAERTTLERALVRSFAPEFLGRLDEIVLFRPLAPDALRAVANQALLDLALRVRRSARRVCFSSAVSRWAAAHGADAAGARGVLHCIRRHLEAPLAEALLAAGEDEWIEVSIRRGKPHFAHAA